MIKGNAVERRSARKMPAKMAAALKFPATSKATSITATIAMGMETLNFFLGSECVATHGIKDEEEFSKDSRSPARRREKG